jgi:hypothetical protein
MSTTETATTMAKVDTCPQLPAQRRHRPVLPLPLPLWRRTCHDGGRVGIHRRRHYGDDVPPLLRRSLPCHLRIRLLLHLHLHLRHNTGAPGRSTRPFAPNRRRFSSGWDGITLDGMRYFVASILCPWTKTTVLAALWTMTTVVGWGSLLFHSGSSPPLPQSPTPPLPPRR